MGAETRNNMEVLRLGRLAECVPNLTHLTLCILDAALYNTLRILQAVGTNVSQ